MKRTLNAPIIWCWPVLLPSHFSFLFFSSSFLCLTSHSSGVPPLALFWHQSKPLFFFFCHSCHLYFHVNTWIKDRNHNKVCRFFLCGQDATAVKVTFVYCCTLWCFRSQLFPCFWHPNLWAPDNELKMPTEPLSGAPSQEIIYRSASCGVLAAFSRLAMSSEPRLFVIVLSFFHDAILTGMNGNSAVCMLVPSNDLSTTKLLRNIWVCIKAPLRPAQYNFKNWMRACVLCSNNQQNRNKAS